MAATKAEIRRWLVRAKRKGATHMLIVCDAFNYEDYPIYVYKDENIHNIVKRNNSTQEMSRVVEVYSLRLDLEHQLNEPLAYHLD